MRVNNTFRDKVKRMRNHVYCLQSRAKQLQREQNMVQQQLAVLDGLLYARNAWTHALQAVLQADQQDCDDWLELTQDSIDMELQGLLSEHAHDPERILQQLPMLKALSLIDRRMHASVMELTPDTAAKQWVAYVSDTMQLLVLHELDAEMAAPLLAAHMSNAVAWLLCFYYFNTQVALQLHDINLLTRQSEVPPPGHWQGAFAAAQLSQEQQQHIAVVAKFVLPRLQHLQQEQQQLMQEMAELQQNGVTSVALTGGTEEASVVGSDSPGTPTYPASTGNLPTDSAAVAAMAAEAAAAGGVSSATAGTGAAATAGSSLSQSDAAPSSDGSSDSGAAAEDTSNYARQKQMARANELTQKIAANCRAWVVVTSMRAHYSVAVMTPMQLARLVTAAAPFLLTGAPIYDQIIANNLGPPAAAPGRT